MCFGGSAGPGYTIGRSEDDAVTDGGELGARPGDVIKRVACSGGPVSPGDAVVGGDDGAAVSYGYELGSRPDDRRKPVTLWQRFSPSPLALCQGSLSQE